MKHVIIGNGPAGVIAAETLRRADPGAGIVLIGDEPEPPYSRMAIPYLLKGDIGEQGTYLRADKGHFERLQIRLTTARASKVDTTARAVSLSNGEEISYDRLLIATGSRPVRLPVPGMDLPDVHSCWTLADARQIAVKAAAGARVLQVGAGFIGCIVMQALVQRGVKLTVVEMGDRMVPRMMTAKAGELIRRWVEQKGVGVHVNNRVVAIENGAKGSSAKGKRGSSAMRVRLSGGQAIECDLVIAAAGVAPNIEFLEGSGVKCGRGVLVDEHMQASVPGVYAAGDVAEAAGFHSGLPEINAIQPNAADQARIAATNMAGGHSAAQGALAIHVLDTLGLVSTSFGCWQGASGTDGGQSVELVSEAEPRYLSLQFRDDALIGATSIGWRDHAGALRGLIQGRVRLGEWKTRLLKDPTQFMTAYLGAAQKSA